MTPQQKFMKLLEERDYSTLNVPSEFLHFIKMRDKLAYFSLQLEPFFNQFPWDLPVVVDGQKYSPADLMRLQFKGMSSVEFFDLLTDIEFALIEAAARRGISLNCRPKIDVEDNFSSSPQQSRSGQDTALGE